MHEREKIYKRLCKFFIEIFEFTDEQLAAIDYQIPMTQEIYDSVLDRCMELGTATDDLFNRMLLEYPDFMSVYAQKIEDEVNEKYADIDIPESSPEELDAGWEDLCRRIREKYGEDAI
ncbi:hypothetical protein H6A64_14545 [Lacrimispora saccharolytica]|nr:hypothetical protein [Lacrimispora saccharolytica]